MTTANTFSLSIRLGNEAMQTGADVAEQLHRAADYLADYYDALSADTAQSIYDQNGNRVGEWRAERTERQESADEIAKNIRIANGHGLNDRQIRLDGHELHRMLTAAARAARGEV